MRLRARTDANHAGIVQALRKVGCGVLDLSRVGKGCPDLLVSFQNGKRRDMVFLEVKTLKGKATSDQRAFAAAGWEVFIVRSIDDALRVVGR
jgi:hypothetical protein